MYIAFPCSILLPTLPSWWLLCNKSLHPNPWFGWRRPHPPEPLTAWSSARAGYAAGASWMQVCAVLLHQGPASHSTHLPRVFPSSPTVEEWLWFHVLLWALAASWQCPPPPHPHLAHSKTELSIFVHSTCCRQKGDTWKESGFWFCCF